SFASRALVSASFSAARMICAARSSASLNRDAATRPWMIQNNQAPRHAPTATAMMISARSVVIAASVRQAKNHRRPVGICHVKESEGREKPDQTEDGRL